MIFLSVSIAYARLAITDNLAGNGVFL